MTMTLIPYLAGEGGKGFSLYVNPYFTREKSLYRYSTFFHYNSLR